MHLWRALKKTRLVRHPAASYRLASLSSFAIYIRRGKAARLLRGMPSFEICLFASFAARRWRLRARGRRRATAAAAGPTQASAPCAKSWP